MSEFLVEVVMQTSESAALLANFRFFHLSKNPSFQITLGRKKKNSSFACKIFEIRCLSLLDV